MPLRAWLVRVPPRRRGHVRGHILPPCLSNVLLIYTCWARGCIGMGRTLMASITQQASLLPFKIHFKRLCGTEVRPCIVAVLMSGCEQHGVSFILFCFVLNKMLF